MPTLNASKQQSFIKDLGVYPMALLIWAGVHHMSALCGHPMGCLWTQWSRMASLSVHSAAYRADLVSGETHKDGMAQTVGTLPHTLGSPQLVGSPCPPPPQVSCALCFVAEEWPQGIFSRVPLGLRESHPPFFFFFFFLPDYSVQLAWS